MSTAKQPQITIEPIISYPSEAQVGKTYLMTVDLSTKASMDDWPFDDDEYPVSITLDTMPAFSCESIGGIDGPMVVLHRFGRTYGPACFLLTALQEELEGRIEVKLVNLWGMPIEQIDLKSRITMYGPSQTPYNIIFSFAGRRKEAISDTTISELLLSLPREDRTNEEKINALLDQTVILLSLKIDPDLFVRFAKLSTDEIVEQWYSTLYYLYQDSRTNLEKAMKALLLGQIWHSTVEADKQSSRKTLLEMAGTFAREIAQATGGTTRFIKNVGQWAAYEMLEVFTHSSLHIPESLYLVFFTGSEWREKEDMDSFRLLLPHLQKDRYGIIGLVSSLQEDDRAKCIAHLRRELELDAVNLISLTVQDILSIIAAKEPLDILLSQLLKEINLLIISPYKITGPATDDMFFGREREIREITDQAKSTSYAIIGGRRVGKSSFLFRLHLNSLPRKGFRTIYHDCTTTPTYKDFMEARLSRWQPEPESGSHLPATFGELLQSPPTDMPLVLLLDEADKLIPADRVDHWRLFNALRSSVSLGHMQVILCGETRLLDALKEDNSPLFNFVNERRLGPLDYSDVEKLVTRPMQQMGIILEDKQVIVKRIWDFTSGHPNVVQRFCHRLIVRLHTQRSRYIHLRDVEAVISDPKFQEEDFIETYMAQATPLERIIALLMATREEHKPSRLQDIVSLLGANGLYPSVESIRDALAQLTELRSILKHDRVGYVFAVEAFPRVLRDRVIIDDMLTELRNEYQWSKRNLEEEKSLSTELDAVPILARGKQFDVFLSYSSKDRIWVDRLKEALQKQGLQVWLDHDQIRPGDLFAGALERGLEESKSVALIVSTESMESGWVEEEYRSALSLTHDKQRPLQLIPVILRNAELPGFLASRQWVDFREESMFAQSLEQLIWGITGKKRTTSAPHREIRFFQAGPPLSGDTSLYIERKADHEALAYVQNMDYLSIIEPPLQGKTSLIYQLMTRLVPKGYTFVICDQMNGRFRKESEEEWYRSLGKWVLNNLNFIANEAQPSLPGNSTEWQMFLESIAKATSGTKRRVVITFDMLQFIPLAYTTPFFTVIRSIYNERPIIPSLGHLTFITSGSISPKELIQDEGVSKFNIEQTIELEDFTLEQVRQLVDNLQLSSKAAEMVAKRIYYWTDGQPYLTQKLCLLLSGIPESVLMGSPQLTREVDRLVKQLFEDRHYIDRIKSLSEGEPKLFQYVQGIADGHKPMFNQALNDEHFRLANMYGVIKADLRGRCRIRNRICGRALKNIKMHNYY